MLKPETARTILNLALNFGLLGIGMTLAVLLWITLTDGFGTGYLSWTVPTSVRLQIDGQSFQASRISLTFPHAPVWAWAVWLGYNLLLLSVLFVGYRRLKTFVNRLLDDPFDQANILDLGLAARLALLWQIISLLMSAVSWWIIAQTRPVEALKTALADSPDIKILDSSYNFPLTSPSFLGIDLTPLLVAALFAILATVFQRAHDLREAERQLRTEQELTV